MVWMVLVLEGPALEALAVGAEEQASQIFVHEVGTAV
jgi:hypothetical protein